MKAMGTASPPTSKIASVPWWDDISVRVREELSLEDRSSLELPVKADVAVIGGGVSGLSAALTAAKLGASTILFERSTTLGSGASGRNAGIACAGVNMPFTDASDAHVARMWIETTEALSKLLSRCGNGDNLLKGARTGSMFLATDAATARRLEKEVAMYARVNIGAQLWQRTDIERVTHGRLNLKKVPAALYLPEEGRIHPLSLLAQLSFEARQAGARLIGNAAVKSFERKDGGSGTTLWLVSLDDGSKLWAENLILGTGPLTDANHRIYAMSFDLDLEEDFPVFQDAAPFTYFDYRPGDGRLVVSGGPYGHAGDTASDAEFHRKMARMTRSWLPELKKIEPRHMWAVDLNVAPDMVPQLRFLDEEKTGMSVEGLGALGVLPGIILGQEAAQRACKQRI